MVRKVIGRSARRPAIGTASRTSTSSQRDRSAHSVRDARPERGFREGLGASATREGREVREVRDVRETRSTRPTRAASGKSTKSAWDKKPRERFDRRPKERVERRPRGSSPAQEPVQEFIAGRRAVMEALKGGRVLNKLIVQENAAGGSLNELLHRAREQSVVIQQAPKAKLDEIAQNASHQGVIAYVAAKPYVELDDLIRLAAQKKPGLLVVLDGIEDPHNLGSILRSVDGAGAAGVIIPKRRAVPLTGTVAKASAGALEHVEVARVSNIVQAINQLKDAGFWVIGSVASAKQYHWQADFTMPTALVIGNEGEGLARLTAERCDMLVKLQMSGQVESLNAGVAAGILLYEAVRQRARGRH